MSVLSQREDMWTAIAENTTISLNWNASGAGQDKNTAPAAPNNCTLPQVRMEKVLALRQQLAEGTYDFDLRLGTVVDRLFKELNA